MRKYTYNRVLFDHNRLPVVANELLTDKELQHYLDKHMGTIRTVKVKVFASEIYWFFGARFTSGKCLPVTN